MGGAYLSLPKREVRQGEKVIGFAGSSPLVRDER